MAKSTNQLNKIVRFLSRGNQISSAVAERKFGVRRLPARIYDLRQEGFKIYTNTKRVSGRNVTFYRLDTAQQSA